MKSEYLDSWYSVFSCLEKLCGFLLVFLKIIPESIYIYIYNHIQYLFHCSPTTSIRMVLGLCFGRISQSVASLETYMDLIRYTYVSTYIYNLAKIKRSCK